MSDLISPDPSFEEVLMVSYSPSPTVRRALIVNLVLFIFGLIFKSLIVAFLDAVLSIKDFFRLSFIANGTAALDASLRRHPSLKYLESDVRDDLSLTVTLRPLSQSLVKLGCLSIEYELKCCTPATVWN